MTQDIFLLNLWRDICGLPEIEFYTPPKVTLDEIKTSEWSEEFERLRRNRMVMGYYRYGPIKQQKGNWKRVDYIINKAKRYDETGNKECLVDIANVAMVEFMDCHHPKAHFSSLDDQEHGEKKRLGVG